MNPVTISYPPTTRIDTSLTYIGKWPGREFTWVRGLMKPSPMRLPVSPEILQYHSYVTGEASIGRNLTRNLVVVEAILHHLRVHVDLQGTFTIMELCAGTGILTTPLAEYAQIVAFEKDMKYLAAYQGYLDNAAANGTQQIRKRIRLQRGDITQRAPILEKAATSSVEVVILNPPFSLIPEALETAEASAPNTIIAVMPLDVIVESSGAYSYRRLHCQETVQNDVCFMESFRKRWELTAIEPLLRPDGTAGVGVFVFLPAPAPTRDA